mgnify:CR=1 FL=1
MHGCSGVLFETCLWLPLGMYLSLEFHTCFVIGFPLRLGISTSLSMGMVTCEDKYNVYLSATLKKARTWPGGRLGLDLEFLQFKSFSNKYPPPPSMCNVLLIRAGQASLSNLVGLANMVSHCFMLQFQSCLCMKTVAPSNTDKKFSMQFNVHTADSLWNIPVHAQVTSFPAYPPRPSTPECGIDDVEWPLGFFLIAFSIRQRDNDDQ